MPLESRIGTKPLNQTEVQQLCDRYKINSIADINYNYPKRLRQLLHMELHYSAPLVILDPTYDELGPIADILEGKVSKGFQTGIVLRQIEHKGIEYAFLVEAPSVEHLFDNTQLRSCSFHPKGTRSWQASMLINHPYAAFVHLARDYGNPKQKNIGISINFMADGWMGSRGIVVVDDVEGYIKQLPDFWRNGFRDANERFARHNGIEWMLYGDQHGRYDATATQMSRHIAKRFGRSILVPIEIRGHAQAEERFKTEVYVGSLGKQGNPPSMYSGTLYKFEPDRLSSPSLGPPRL